RAHGAAEVEMAVMAPPPALGQARREQSRERLDRALQRQHLVARRVHEVDVFGERLAQRARHRVDAPVGHEPTTNLLLDQLPELAQAHLELLAREALAER